MADTVDAGDLDAALTSSHAHVKFRHKKHNWKKISKLTPFERRYTELGMNLKPEKKRIDYILIHKVEEEKNNETDKNKLEEKQRIVEDRRKFETVCQSDGLQMQKDTIGEFVYTKLHCPFKRLCFEAELVKLEMPLKGCEIYPEEQRWECTERIYEKFETDDAIDYVSAPFLMDRIQLYEGYEDPTNFFRPALRSLLTHRILINLDIRSEVEIDADGSLSNKGLPYMLMHSVYTDSYILHDESISDPIDKQKLKENKHKNTSEKSQADIEKNGIDLSAKPKKTDALELDIDPRKELDDTWTRVTKFQPFWKIRDYFGEKIALYFAWTGMLTATLWIPTVFGLCIFFYGITLSATTYVVTHTTDNTTHDVVETAKGLFGVIKKSFDNDITPYFALIICLWGTVFLELWKRKTSSLAYEWDVDTYEDNEPDRPQFYGTEKTPDPVTKELNWYYPIKKQFIKFAMSASTLILMILVVFVSVIGVIVYRVIFSVDYCPNVSAPACLLMTIVISSLFNGISILILGKVYDYLAMKLTEWENHRTQTSFDDALIIKLFAFQFANSYASCFYIAFFRGADFASSGILGLGSSYTDGCQDNNCMSQLSIQVLILMLIKPFPKFLKDIIVPFLRKLWRMRPSGMFRCHQHIADTKTDKSLLPFHEYLERERLKPQLGDFTLGEYTEKVIQYGYLMLFAASFPLAPLLALLTNLVDIRVDAKRLLWWNRRPVAFIAQDIGMWYAILVFVNFCGVVSNAFLIAFTSSWGREFSPLNRLWLVIGFEHIVFVVKFILDYIIPDVPREVTLAIRREKYQIAKKLNVGGKMSYVDMANLIPKDAEGDGDKRRRRKKKDGLTHPPPGPLSDSHAAVSISGVGPMESITEHGDDQTSLPSVETTDRYLLDSASSPNSSWLA